MIHTYSLFGYNIALDINSGAVHVPDDLAFEMLKSISLPMPSACPNDIIEKFSGHDEAEVREAWDELFELYAGGLLFSEDTYAGIARAVPKHSTVKALCLHVAHDCNLRCEYCFAATGDFGMTRRVMDIDTAKRAIDFVIQRSGPRRNIEIDFFGGEPLMAMDTVRQTVEYARSLEKELGKHFRFTITTNGLLLNDEISDYINENMDNVVLSLDGREAVNDRLRKTIKGEGSYRIILPKFKRLVSGRKKDYYVRGTFTRLNIDFSNDVQHIAAEGFTHVSVEPVSLNECEPYSITANELPRVFEEYETLARRILDGADFDFFHFNVDLEQGSCVLKRLRGCGAGYEYVAVTPEGDIYPCHQFVGNKVYKMGSVLTGAFDQSISDKFKAQNIYTREACMCCWARFYCSGGCAASNISCGGGIDIPNEAACAMLKKRLECAIAIAAYKALRTGDSC